MVRSVHMYSLCVNGMDSLTSALGAERFLAEIKVTAKLRHPNEPAVSTLTASRQAVYRGDFARFFAMQERVVASSGIAGASPAALRRAWQMGGRDATLRAQIAVADRLDLLYEAGQWRMKAGDVDGVLRDKVYFNSQAVRRDLRFKALLATMKIAEDAP